MGKIGKSIGGFLFCFLICGVVGVVDAQFKIAYVDVAKVFDEYKGTEKSKKDLERDFKLKQKEIQDERENIEKSRKEFDEQKLILSKDKAIEKESEIKSKIETLQKNVEDAKLELAKKEKKLTDEIVLEIYSVVKQIATKENYDYVFEKNSLLFGGENITEKVIKILNERK